MSKFRPAIAFHGAAAKDGRRASDVNMFYAPGVLGDFDAKRCQEFRSRFPNTFTLAQLNPLYLLPEQLITEITTKFPKWFTEEELQFERALSVFCQSVGAIGIAEDSFVTSTLFGLSAVSPSKRSPAIATTPKNNQANSDQGIRRCEELAEQIYDELRGYVGWLVTNPVFLDERERIRVRRSQLRLRLSFSQFFDGGRDTEFREFLQKWMLTGMSSWELPIPQGPNLSGATWPVSATNLPGRVNISLPSTVSLPASFPLRQVVADARQLNTLEHLRPWQQILERKVGEHGIDHFASLFRLHFYLTIVLRSRYGSQINFGGRTAAIDIAFGEFLGVGDDRVKQLRLHAQTRVAGL